MKKVEEIGMTKKEFAAKLYFELKGKKDVQKVADTIKSAKINGRKLDLDEQLEIIRLIRHIHREQQIGIFESVDSFLVLVNQVERKVKSQNSSTSGGNNEGK